MKIINIQILEREAGTDLVFCHTDLPSPFPKEVSEQPMSFSFDVQKGKAKQYVTLNFPGIPFTII